MIAARATLSADGKAVTHSKGSWSETFPISALPDRLTLYRGLWHRGGKKGEPGPYARFYEADIKALERVEKMAKVMGTA